MKAPRTIARVVDDHLCLGCGACAYICPTGAVDLVDRVHEGIRPVVRAEDCTGCAECLAVCPAVENDHTELGRRPGIRTELIRHCGPVLDIWEGHAADPEIRFAGSSGGLLTALALYCLEREAMHGVLHIGMDGDDRTRNRTTLSRTRDDLLANTGSRYAPASACDGLARIEAAPRPCVFIGQPTEVTALRKAARLRPALERNIGLALSFFCAGSPAREGTLALLAECGLRPADVTGLRYRGLGWPGTFAVTVNGEARPRAQRTYQESWAFLQAFRPHASLLCPDGTGEDADIACGDPWYREVAPGEPGSSLVVTRTELGRRIVHEAVRAGYVALTEAEPWKLLASQANLLAKRGIVGGRVATLTALGRPVPRLRGFSLFAAWCDLSLRDKLRSIVGTARRVARSERRRREELGGEDATVMTAAPPSRPDRPLT